MPVSSLLLLLKWLYSEAEILKHMVPRFRMCEAISTLPHSLYGVVFHYAQE